MEYVKCPECGMIVEKQIETCPKCGYPFEGEPSIKTKICPECNNIVEEELSECSHCGYPFEDELERMLKEAEEKTLELEKKALEAEAKLKKLEQEKEEKRLREQKLKEKEEKQKKLEAARKKMQEVEKRAQEAEQKIAQFKESDDQESILLGQNKNIDDMVECDNVDEANLNDIVAEEVEDSSIPEVIDTLNPLSENVFDIENQKSKVTSKKKIICGIAIGAVVCVGIIVGFFKLRGTPVESIELEHESATMDLGSLGKVDYTILPKDATNTEVKWDSSDESILTVDEDGYITALKEGSCEITVTAHNGKSDSCTISVKPAGPDLKKVYQECCDSAYASVASDGSYLSIDTKPDGTYKDYEDEAIAAIFLVNLELGIPDSVIQKMSKTRALDGIQSQVCGDIEVSWSYHPDNGLEVIYALTN